MALPFFLPLPLLPVLHENKLSHTDLKPENILFVNSDYEMTYNLDKVNLSIGGSQFAPQQIRQ